MNPWGVVYLIVGIILLVIAWKGSQDNVISALTGKPYGSSTLS